MLKPNILWICTDQQRFDTMGCYGNEKVDTPNIDELAAQGILFENAYCQSPVCSPSRASFLTGRYPRTCRVRQNGQQMPADEVLVTKEFANQGYTVGLVGKLHISPCHTSVCKSSEKRIDDGYHVFHWSHHPDFYGKESNWPLNEYNMWLKGKGKEYKRTPYKESPYLTVGPDQEDSHSRWCAEKSIAFIHAHEAYPENPWFLSVNFYDPHHDFDPDTKLLEKYIGRMEQGDLPNYVQGELEEKALVQGIDHKGAYGVPGWYDFDKMEDKDHLQVKAAYYAMVEQMDTEVGRIVAVLKETGQYDNTIIIFHSDHGEMLGDHGIYLKGGYFYDPMVKVPLIISWPKKLAVGERRNALVELTDLAPTVLQLCGLEENQGIQGESLCELLSSSCKVDNLRESVYCEYYNSMRHNGGRGCFATMVFDGRYKLCYYHDEDKGELYDLQEDSQETKNVYSNEYYQEIRLKLLEKMVNRMAFSSDPLPLRMAAY